MTTTDNKYDNSRPFDVHRWSEYPQLLEATKRMYAELFTRSEKKKMTQLRVVLVDLYRCHLEDPEKYAGYHRGHDRYHADSRYNKLHISFRPLITVIDALIKHKYIEGPGGFKDRNTGIGYISRMRATTKLIDFIECSAEDNTRRPIPPHVIYRHPDEEVIILKDSNKNLMEYEDTEETNRMRQELRAYNDLLERTFIDIDLVGYPESVRIDTTNKRVRRIFNNGTFEQGGRFYGGWWQNVKKDLRERIMMGETDKPTIEMDYKALHINLLYNLVGINYFEQFGGEGADPYQVKPVEDQRERDIWRNFYKLVLLACINSDSELNARKGIWKKLINTDETNKYPAMKNHQQIKGAIKAFERLHAPIAHYFYSGIGLELQRVDSMIAERVIRHFVKKGLPVLCVHDSFICTTRDSNHLEDVIQEAMQETMKELGGKWGRCPITPLYKTEDRRTKKDKTNQCDSDTPVFVEWTLNDIAKEYYEKGSYSPRINLWRDQKIQTIINY